MISVHSQLTPLFRVVVVQKLHGRRIWWREAALLMVIRNLRGKEPRRKGPGFRCIMPKGRPP